MVEQRKQYKTPKAYLDGEGIKHVFARKRWKLSHFKMVAVTTRRYPVSLSDEQVRLIAADLRQPVEYVRKLYPKVA